jgi:hypothetical protein
MRGGWHVHLLAHTHTHTHTHLLSAASAVSKGPTRVHATCQAQQNAAHVSMHVQLCCALCCADVCLPPETVSAYYPPRPSWAPGNQSIVYSPAPLNVTGPGPARNWAYTYWIPDVAYDNTFGSTEPAQVRSSHNQMSAGWPACSAQSSDAAMPTQHAHGSMLHLVCLCGCTVMPTRAGGTWLNAHTLVNTAVAWSDCILCRCESYSHIWCATSKGLYHASPEQPTPPALSSQQPSLLRRNWQHTPLLCLHWPPVPTSSASCATRLWTLH